MRRLRRWFRRVRNGVRRIVRGIARIVEGIANFLRGVIRGIIFLIPNLIRLGVRDGLGAFWRDLFTNGIAKGLRILVDGIAEIIQGVLDIAFSVLGERVGGFLAEHIGSAFRSVILGLVDGLIGIVENAIEMVGDSLQGLAKVFRGEFRAGFRQFFIAPLKGLQTLFDLVVVFGGSVISAIQVILGLENPGRQLNDSEITLLRRVYANSIDYLSVRIKENSTRRVAGRSGLFGANNRPFVLGHSIYMKDIRFSDRCIDPASGEPFFIDLGLPPDAIDYYATLVHEICHVWQLQNGGTDYLSKSLWWQHRLGGDAYNWRRSVPATAWSDLESEQQAAFLEDAIRGRGFFDPTSPCYERFEFAACTTLTVPTPATALDVYLVESLQLIRPGIGA